MNSIKKSIKGIKIMILASFFTSFGQLFWKLSKGIIGLEIIVGFILYGIGAILIVKAFKYGRFSLLHPMLSTSYIFAVFLGNFILNENISFFKIFGVLMIIMGVIFVGVGDKID